MPGIFDCFCMLGPNPSDRMLLESQSGTNRELITIKKYIWCVNFSSESFCIVWVDLLQAGQSNIFFTECSGTLHEHVVSYVSQITDGMCSSNKCCCCCTTQLNSSPHFEFPKILSLTDLTFNDRVHWFI